MPPFVLLQPLSPVRSGRWRLPPAAPCSANLTAQSEIKAGDEEMLPQHRHLRAELDLQDGAETTGVSHQRGSRLPNPNVQSGSTGQEHQHSAAGPGAQLQGYFLSQKICGTCRLWGWVGTHSGSACPCLPPSFSWGGVEGRLSGRASISLITQNKNSS